MGLVRATPGRSSTTLSESPCAPGILSVSSFGTSMCEISRRSRSPSMVASYGLTRSGCRRYSTCSFSPLGMVSRALKRW